MPLQFAQVEPEVGLNTRNHILDVFDIMLEFGDCFNMSCCNCLESNPKIVDFELWMAPQGKFKHVGLC